MSLLQKAKVITTPTAYSDGFVHSVKPEIVENVWLQSTNLDTFPNATTAAASITGGQSGYDGSSNAWELESLSDGFYRRLYQSVTQTGVITFSIYAKSANTDFLLIYNNQNGDRAYFDLSTGSLGDLNGAIDSSIEDIGNGWYRCSISLITSASSEFWICPTNENNVASCDLGNSIYIQDAQLNKGLTAYPYIETTSVTKPSADFDFSRGSSATRVNELGYIEDVQIIGGELLSNGDFEEVGSEEVTNGGFDTDSDWTKANGATISEGKGNIIGDDPSFTHLSQPNVFTVGKFYKVSLDAVINSGLGLKVQDGLTNENFGAITTSGTYTFYGEANDSTLTIGRRDGGIAFDSYIDNVSVKEVGQDWTLGTGWSIEDGVVSLNAPTGNLDQILTTTGGSKYRVTFTISNYVSGDIRWRFTGASNENGTLRSANGTYTEEITLTNSQSVFRFPATGGVMDIDNISVKEITDDTDIPRINYEGFTYQNGLPVPYSGVGSWLFEPQSTNLITYSEDFSQSVWLKSGCNTSYGYLSPSGELNATKLTGTNPDPYILCTKNGVTDLTYSASIYIKGTATTTGKTARLWIIRDSVEFPFEDFTITDNWQRISTTKTFSTTPTGSVLFRLDTPNNDISIGDETYVWGAQLEEGHSTSYIPTSGTAVTRLADVCNNAGNSDLFDSEGVLYAEIAALADDGTNRILGISNGGDFNNSVLLRYSSVTNRIQAQVRLSGVYQCTLNYEISDSTEFSKVAFRFAENDFSLWVDGVERAVDTSGSVISGLSELSFDVSTSNEFYGKTKMVAVFPYLSNDEMECLTGEGYGTFEALAAAYSYTIK